MKSRFFAGLSAASIAAFACGFASAETPDVVIPTPSILEDLAGALEHDPTDVSTRLRLASMLQNLGQHEEARVLLDEAMALSKDVANAIAPGAQIAAGDCLGCELGNSGPDVIVGDLNGIGHYGVTTFNGVQYRAYSVGTTSCNLGTQNLSWIQGNNRHPTIAQNIYRYDGRSIEQIGVGHLKHGFCALQENLCAQPGNPCQPAGGGCASALGVFCSDPYTASLNGQQNLLGPRWQVNAYTGVFPYPFQGGSIQNATIGRRIAVRTADLTTDTSVKYFAEGMYVHPDDASAGNGGNNASYRELRWFTNGQFSMVGTTQRTKPAILAWQANDPEVHVDIVESEGDGRFYVASRAYDNGDGTWDYEYAVFNLNNHSSGRAFTVPTGGAVVSNAGFKGVEYHSGDGVGGVTQDLTPWNATQRGDGMRWEVVDIGANSNALRWATMYNYRFTANAGPVESQGSIDLFRVEGTVPVTVIAPAGACTLGADTNGDNIVNFADLNTVLGAFGQTGPGNPADVTGDEVVNFADMNAVLAEFGADCN